MTTVAEPPGFGSSRRAGELAQALRRRRRLRAGIMQLLYVSVAVAIGVLAPRIDTGPTLSAPRAIEMLLAVGAGTVTFIGLVFSLLFIVVQFGSTAFTPRLSLFRDAPIVWHSFAFFTAVIVYSFTAAIAAGRDDEVSALVPIISVVGVLGTVGLYRVLQMSAFRSIQLAPTLLEVARRGREVIDGLYLAELPPAPATARSMDEPAGEDSREVVWSRGSTVLQVIDVPRVLRLAERTDTVIGFAVGSGDTVVEGARVAAVAGPPGAALDHELLVTLTVGVERTFEQDPTFALRVLSDIALRALSPAVNDPSTAVQALDATDGLLRRLVVRDLAVGRIRGADGAVRVHLAMPVWEDFLAVSVDEVLALEHRSPMVRARLRRLLDDLLALASAGRRPAIEARLRSMRLANPPAR